LGRASVARARVLPSAVADAYSFLLKWKAVIGSPSRK
jgi:hypothetical protein